MSLGALAHMSRGEPGDMLAVATGDMEILGVLGDIVPCRPPGDISPGARGGMCPVHQ